MLQNDFYHLESLEEIEGKWHARVRLNEGHAIFEGHFPNNPVVPGVTMIQMTREISEIILEKKLDIVSTHHIKFMAVVNPKEHKRITMELVFKTVEEGWNVRNTMRIEDTVCLKFQGVMGEDSFPTLPNAST